MALFTGEAVSISHVIGSMSLGGSHLTNHKWLTATYGSFTVYILKTILKACPLMNV